MLSIIILAKNKLHELTIPCINSILKNTYSNYELVCIDNCGADDTFDYFKKLTQKSFRNITNCGVAAGRNIGLKMASGDPLVFLDNDTIVPYAWDLWIIRALGHLNVGIAGGIPSNEIWRLSHPHSSDGLIDFPYISFATSGFHRKLYNQIGLMDEAMEYAGEDTDYCLRARKLGYRTVVIPELIIQHKNFGTRGQLESSQIAESQRRFYNKHGGF